MSGVTRNSALPSFDPHRCKRCGLCAALCPSDAIESSPQISQAVDRWRPALLDPEACNGCATCELVCPDFAIMMVSGARLGAVLVAEQARAGKA